MAFFNRSFRKTSDRVPNIISTQKKVIHLDKKLKKGDTWYLVDVRWMQIWKKYVGYDHWDQSSAGQQVPGPVETSSLFADVAKEKLKEHLIEELHYSLVPEAAWQKLIQWYGMAPGSRPIPRKVVWYGLDMKHLKVEIYKLEFKLAVHPKLKEHIIEDFSRGDTVADLEAAMRKIYAIPADTMCRVWHQYMPDVCELLIDSQTLGNAGLFNMQTIFIEQMNADGTWPRYEDEICVRYNTAQQSKGNATGESKSKEEVETTTNESPASFCGGIWEQEPHKRQLPKQAAGDEEQEAEQEISEGNWLHKQQQSQHDELVQSIATEQKRANQASQRAQDALIRLAQQEEELKSLNKALEENQLQLQKHERSLTEEQQRRLETEAQAEQNVARLQSQLQILTKSLQDAEEEKNVATQQAEAAESQASLAEVGMKQLRESLQAVEEERNGSVQRIRTLENRLQDTEQQLQQAYQRADQQQERATTAETRLQHSDQVFQDMFQRLIGQLPQSQPHWVVQRNEIELSEEVLGAGGWASVRVGTFRGNRVAAKCLHRQIISAHNVRLFTREMNMAANARHPNLLQFIGATLDNEEPIILTELMPTSLRRVLEEGTRLTHPQIVSVSRQVALALNYLHLMQPEAIIHRDVSSSNVLLEPQPSSNWKAKLSDYGSANFVRHTTTAGPGNPTYAAPEANNPEQQSAKMDVFSFGVLLVEMCSGELAPAEHRDRLLATVLWPAMVALIRQCLRHEPQRRLNMSTVITQLDQL